LTKEQLPHFGDNGIESFFTPYSLVLVSVISTAYIAHYNAPKFYDELKDATPKRFDIVVMFAFGISGIVMSIIGCVGFMTFGDASSGFILDNYSTNDVLASLSRIGVSLSVTFSYPLPFSGGRDGIMDLLEIPHEKRTTSTIRCISLAMLVVITNLALFLNNLTFVVAFGGATLSVLVIYFFPPLMYRAVLLSSSEQATDVEEDTQPQLPRSVKWQLRMGMGMLYFGIAIGIIGAIMSIADESL